MEELKEQVKVVALARENLRIAKEAKNIAYQAWEREYISLLNQVDDTNNQVNEAENKLRELTIKTYQETGNKKPIPEVGIREVTRLDYEPQVAFNWAIEHKLALSLDRKSFESLAKTNNLDFVKTSIEPQATIATDLSSLLS